MRRLSLATLPLLLAATPALAQEPAPTYAPDAATAKASEWLSDPAQQEKLAQGMAAIIDAMLQVKVGPLADVIARVDPTSDAAALPRDATLAEAMGSDGRDGERMGEQVRSTARMTSTAAQVMGAYLPVLRDMARDVAAQVERQYSAPQKSDQ